MIAWNDASSREVARARLGIVVEVPSLMRGSRLSFDPASRTARWKAPLAQREIQADRIVRIARARPAVFALECLEGPDSEFWLSSTNRPVRTFFDELFRASPAIAGSDLYRRAWPWWRGLQPTV
jgi:hypothetical protein